MVIPHLFCKEDTIEEKQICEVNHAVAYMGAYRIVCELSNEEFDIFWVDVSPIRFGKYRLEIILFWGQIKEDRFG